MAELTTTPATARTDVRGERPTPTVPGISISTTRRLGATLAVGAAAYASSFLLIGPTTGGVGGRIGDLLGLAFQIGLFSLLTVMLKTRATGTSRAAVALLKVEFGLLSLASTWSLLHGTLPASMQDDAWLAVLDVFWPLSMLGMFVIAIKLAFAGRWTGVLRAYPLVAESWVVFTVPSMAIFGAAIGAWVGGLHMLFGYAVLGLLVALRPQLTGAR